MATGSAEGWAGPSSTGSSLREQSRLRRAGSGATASGRRFLAAFTPIPYKVFAVTAGVLDLDRRSFALASLAGRGARFLTIGILVMLFGEEIQEFITGNFEILTIAGGLAVVALAVAWHLFHRMRGRTPGGRRRGAAVIFDSHAYCFLPADSARGYADGAEHLRWVQSAQRGTPPARLPHPRQGARPVRRARAGGASYRASSPTWGSTSTTSGAVSRGSTRVRSIPSTSTRQH